ncbi:hypothetical protein MIN45_P1478 [Methylomarinovum tepidoasis]|uniref:Ice-binding protein C-terminal domain-containing protein n=1 Tax=Methylomarinovum tepidoasis TaxID=2840183 RepID=A0AAU9CFW2_9GAMM|nr:PEP-CTERM sorting domain-containing protein [Methylomarinovum sp. IN45]BCX89108.1 hypothetical protein MIN45_P1478 [Methylomarinovum sp. IN45]
MKTRWHHLALMVGLMWGSAASATLVNGDFSSGFTGWSGQEDYITDFDAADMDASTSPDPFTIVNEAGFTNAAKLSTHYDQTGTGWALSLYQQFTMPTLSASGSTLWLDFDYSVSLDDVAGGDNWYAQLTDKSGSGLPPLDLDVSPGPFDVTAFAGKAVEILFALENIAGGDDTLLIDNVTITERLAAVPEPSILGLLGLGMLLLRRKTF